MGGSGLIIDGITQEGDPLFVASPAADVIDSGAGTLFLSDDGTYKAVSGSSIYSADGSLAGARVMTMAANSLTFAGTQSIVFAAAGEIQVGPMSTAGLGNISTRAAVGMPGIFVETNGDGAGFQDSFVLYNNVTSETLYRLTKHASGNYPIVEINNISGTTLWNLTGSDDDSWMNARMAFGQTAGINNARLLVRGYTPGNTLNLNVTDGNGITGFDVRNDNRVRINAGQLATADFEIYGDVNVAFVQADVGLERLGIGTSSQLAKLHVVSPNALSTQKNLFLENDAGLDLLDVRNNGDIFNSGRIMITQGRTPVNTATYTILPTDRTIGVTRTTTGTCVLTMPLASAFTAGTEIVIKDEGNNASTFTITYNAAGSDTIDDGVATSGTITLNGNSRTLYSDGVSQWFNK